MIDLVKHVNKSIANAIRLKSKLPKDIFDMSGPISHRNKHFFNNLCSFDDCRFLEVGTFAGASVCSAAYGNNIYAETYDDLSEHKGQEQHFRDTIKSVLKKYTQGSTVRFLEQDFELALSMRGHMKFNIYYYDGDHHTRPTAKGIAHFHERMDDKWILVVDDYNLAEVVLGVDQGLEKLLSLGWRTKEEWMLHGNSHNSVEDKSSWWNGLYIAVVERAL